jgi:hypothetical protein
MELRLNDARLRERLGVLRLLELADRVLGERASRLEKLSYLGDVLSGLDLDASQRARLRVELLEQLFAQRGEA